jgi:hypothetical protein
MRSSLDCEIDSNGSVCDLLTTAQVNFSLFMLTTNFQETKFNNSRKKKVAFNGKNSYFEHQVTAFTKLVVNCQ